MAEAFIVAGPTCARARRWARRLAACSGTCGPTICSRTCCRGGRALSGGLERGHVEDVIVGCAMPEAEQGLNVARIGLLLAGFPDPCPA
jgi:acetyl-CoA acetyltransferase